MTVKTTATDVTLQNGSFADWKPPDQHGIRRRHHAPVCRLQFELKRARMFHSSNMQLTTSFPSISMRIAGHPLSLERSYDTSALKSWIVVSVLQRGMDRLEELQRQEQQLIEEERLFREEQAAKEAERERKLLEASQAAARSTDEKPGQQEEDKPGDATERAPQGAPTIEQQRLKDLIEQNVLPEIPDGKRSSIPKTPACRLFNQRRRQTPGLNIPYYLRVQ